MPDTFDPYREWLDLPDGPRPPDHYALLGVRRFESDRQLIAQAADTRLARVRKVRPGQKLRDWGRLLDQIAAIKVCLLDPPSKEAYDASLSAEPSDRDEKAVGSTGAASTASLADHGMASRPADPMAPPEQVPKRRSVPSGPSIGPTDVAAPTEAAKDPAAVRTRRLWRWLALGVAGMVVINVVGMLAGLRDVAHRHESVAARSDAPSLAGSNPPPNASPKPPIAAAKLPSATRPPPAATPRQSSPSGPKTKPAPEATPLPEPTPVPQPTPQPPAPSPPDAGKQATFDRAVSQVRRAMSRRDLRGAEAHLAMALQNVQTAGDEDVLLRQQTMVHNLGEFWSGVREGMAGLESSGELDVGNTRIAVIKADRRHLAYRHAGRNVELPVEELPTAVVLAVADHWFDKKHPSTKVLIGTFLAVDPRGDRKRARALWRQAIKEGIDCEHLLPELDAFPVK